MHYFSYSTAVYSMKNSAIYRCLLIDLLAIKVPEILYCTAMKRPRNSAIFMLAYSKMAVQSTLFPPRLSTATANCSSTAIDSYALPSSGLLSFDSSHAHNLCVWQIYICIYPNLLVPTLHSTAVSRYSICLLCLKELHLLGVGAHVIISESVHSS